MKFKEIKWSEMVNPYNETVVVGKVGDENLDKLIFINIVFHIHKNRDKDGVMLYHYTPFCGIDGIYIYHCNDIEEAKKLALEKLEDHLSYYMTIINNLLQDEIELKLKNKD